MIEIEQANTNNITTIQTLSNIVWPITFGEILSPKQIEYMMGMMYSTESLIKQMTVEQHNYLLAKEGEEYLGYLSYQTDLEEAKTKIHKIYVLPQAQGKGVGYKLIEYAKRVAIEKNNYTLLLNVNRYNKALDFYTHIGFNISRTEDIDIGNGFLMEDYVMEMQI